MRKFLSWPRAVAIMLLIVIVGVLLVVAHRRDRPAIAAPVATPMPRVVTPTQPPANAPALIGPGGFAPLQSQAVKDAIHRALTTGTTQRWQDGTLSGYAVPSTTTGANGCRAVRYTIDQQPDTPYASITACDASAH